MILLTSQKNLLYDLIEEEQFSHSMFRLQELQEDFEIIFKNSNSNFYFNIRFNKNLYYWTYQPGYITVEESNAGKWPSIENPFKNWLRYLKREISQQDKWERFFREIQMLTINTEEGEDKFTVEEYTVLKQRMELLKENINSTDLRSEHLTIINQKLDFLIEQAAHLRKFDWKSLFIGTIVNLTFNLGLTPDNTKAIWDVIKRVFHNLILP